MNIKDFMIVIQYDDIKNHIWNELFHYLNVIVMKGFKEVIFMFEGMSTIEIIKLLAPIIIIQIALIIFSLFKLTRDKVKYLPKWGWTLIILFINFFGPIIYLIIGRERD